MRSPASTPSIRGGAFASSPILRHNHLPFLRLNPPSSSPTRSSPPSIQCSVQFRPCIDIHKVTPLININFLPIHVKKDRFLHVGFYGNDIL